MAHHPYRPPTSISDPDRSPLPPPGLPADVEKLISSAFARRAALEASGARDESTRPMWDLTAQLCSRISALSAEPGVVGIRLCELPADTPPDRVWVKVRTAPRADAWQYARDHHVCVRVGDWRRWAA